MRVLNRIRRNHALEHATLSVLAEGGARGLMAGYSTSGGFWLVAPAPRRQVQEAASTALRRLSAGESRLAISPSCGTNFAVATLLAGLALRLVESRRGGKRSGWPLSAALFVGALVVARPLGGAIQRGLTTLSNMDGVRIREVWSLQVGRFHLHRVLTDQP